ncbi:MAG: peptidoglycan-binding protein [Caulobacter sp.]|nr:peptidoglycan-binding protein [Caulobacter sp.]
MTSGAPWSVKGIDPKAREIAKDLARRSGMTLGEWLNRMIVEGDAPDEPVLDPTFETPLDPVIIGTPRPGAETRYEVAGHPADEVGRVAEAIERLTTRIEAAEQRSTLAITGIDQSVRGALSRLEMAEREQTAVAARFEGAVDELKSEYGGVGERIRRMELESTGPRSAEALRSLEGMLGKVAGQLYEGEARTRETLAAVEARIAAVETAPAVDPAQLAEAVVIRVEEAESRTTDALRDLGASFVVLDRRLRTVESGAGGGGERLEALAADLTRRMEATRAEMAENLRRASEGRFDRMEHKLSEMSTHIQTAETRSAQAIERMGREVVSMADSLSRRVQAVENHGADAVEQIGGEVARIATVVEQKLNRADNVQAQALEKLGGEIARITERLAERIANSERRGALAIDEVGEQVARVTERINQRQERSSADLAERIRQSEERTARLLEEAREKIDASLSNSHRRLAEQVAQGPAAAAGAAAPVLHRPEPPREPFGDPFASEPFPAPGRSIPEEAFAPQAFARPPDEPALPEPEPFPTAERGPPAFSDEDFEAADGFAPLSDEVEVPQAPEIPPGPVIAPLDVDDMPRPRSTREVLDQARAAARMASAPEPRPASAEKRGLFGSSAKKPRRRAGSALTSALVVSVGAVTMAALSVGGVLLVGPDGGGKVADRVAQALQRRDADAKGEVLTAEADTTPAPRDTPRVAVAIGPQGLAPGGAQLVPGLAGGPEAPGEPGATPAESPATLYADAVRRIEARDFTGVPALKRAASLGYAPAQFFLAKLYENGEAGLRKDAAEARRWTERAAQGGDRKAMHNLGLYYFEGQGGAKNTTTAAQWFRKAADLGLSDSQYNLGRLYEEGYGVMQNAAEAYKWYLIAARAGDAEAKSSAERVKKDLSPEARSAAERSAVGFRASGPVAARPAAQASVGGTTAGVTSAQKALSTLGYYRGPQDGVASQGLKGAIAAFQRDQGLPQTGNLDPQTLAKLSTYAR